MISEGGFWKADPGFILVFNWHVLSIFNGLEVIRRFRFAWDFPIRADFWGVLGAKHPHNEICNLSIPQKALPCVRPRILSYYVQESVHGFRRDAIPRNKKKIIKIIIKKATWTVYFTTMWGRHCWSDPNQILQGWCAPGRNHPRKIWSQSVKNCKFGEGLKLPVLALLGLTPLIRLGPAGLPLKDYNLIIETN